MSVFVLRYQPGRSTETSSEVELKNVSDPKRGPCWILRGLQFYGWWKPELEISSERTRLYLIRLQINIRKGKGGTTMRNLISRSDAGGPRINTRRARTNPRPGPVSTLPLLFTVPKKWVTDDPAHFGLKLFFFKKKKRKKLSKFLKYGSFYI